MNEKEDTKKNKDYKGSYEQLAVENLMRTEEGRFYIWSKLQSFGVFESVFHSDPIQHAYRSGIREAGLRFLRDIVAYGSHYYIQMIKENTNG